MATMDSSKNESDTEVETNSNPNPNSSDALVPAPNSGAVCLVRFASDSIGGAFMGSIFGYGLSLSLILWGVFVWNFGFRKIFF
jgi:import inner membrane translocase subunit TIM22